MNQSKVMAIFFSLLVSIGTNAYAGSIGDTGSIICQDATAAPHAYLFDECIKYVIAKDNYGLNEMKNRGLCVELRAGTKVKWLDMKNLKYDVDQIRILEGPYINKALWILHGCGSYSEEPKKQSKRK